MVNTRLPQGYYALEVVDHESVDSNEVHADIVVNPYGQIFWSSVDMGGGFKSMKCKVADVVDQTSYQCKAPAQSDCSVSPKRLCCDCEDGKLRCY